VSPEEVLALLQTIARQQLHISRIEQAAGQLEAENAALHQALAEVSAAADEPTGASPTD
jgi:hypothetical protein